MTRQKQNKHTSYFLTREKRERLKNVAQPSIAYALFVYTCCGSYAMKAPSCWLCGCTNDWESCGCCCRCRAAALMLGWKHRNGSSGAYLGRLFLEDGSIAGFAQLRSPEVCKVRRLHLTVRTARPSDLASGQNIGGCHLIACGALLAGDGSICIIENQIRRPG